MKTMLVLVLSLGLCACGHAHKSVSAAREHSQQEKATASQPKKSAAPYRAGTITANPNPVPAGGELGETTITWKTGGESGEVYVTKNGGDEKLFASGDEGSKTVKWIRAGVRYEFDLFAGSDHKQELAKVAVTHPPKTP